MRNKKSCQSKLPTAKTKKPNPRSVLHPDLTRVAETIIRRLGQKLHRAILPRGLKCATEHFEATRPLRPRHSPAAAQPRTTSGKDWLLSADLQWIGFQA